MHEVVDDNSNPYKKYGYWCEVNNRGYTNQCSIVDEKSNTDATNFFFLLKDYDEPLWDRCTNHSKLSIVAQGVYHEIGLWVEWGWLWKNCWMREKHFT
jgi:hypothetical protein